MKSAIANFTLAVANLGFVIANNANNDEFIENRMIANGCFLPEMNSLPAGLEGVQKLKKLRSSGSLT